MALAVIAGIALFLIGAYSLGHSPEDDSGENDDIDHTVSITLTIDPGLVVKRGNETISSGVSFTASKDVILNITIPRTGEYEMTYQDPARGTGGTTSQFGPGGSTFETIILVFSDSGNITGSITFSAGR